MQELASVDVFHCRPVFAIRPVGHISTGHRRPRRQGRKVLAEIDVPDVVQEVAKKRCKPTPQSLKLAQLRCVWRNRWQSAKQYPAKAGRLSQAVDARHGETIPAFAARWSTDRCQPGGRGRHFARRVPCSYRARGGLKKAQAEMKKLAGLEAAEADVELQKPGQVARRTDAFKHLPIARLPRLTDRSAPQHRSRKRAECCDVKPSRSFRLPARTHRYRRHELPDNYAVVMRTPKQWF